jgi:transcription antitermination factor NusG
MQGNLRQVYEALTWTIGQHIGRGEVNPLMAEVIRGLRPEWYVLQIVPAQERLAVSHLAWRRFGIYAPEVEEQRNVRGRRRRVLLPMFPGYVFVFAWLAPRNYHRIRSCPGVWDFLCVEQKPAVISDAAVNIIREVENKRRPLIFAHEAIGRFKKDRRGWRRRARLTEQQVYDNEIVAVHTWSALRDGCVNGVDSDKRTQLLLNALGVA